MSDAKNDKPFQDCFNLTKMSSKRLDRLNVTCGWWEQFSFYISNGLGQLFYKLGLKVATYPWLTVLLTWLIFSASLLGFFNIQYEENILESVIPADSKFAQDTNWFFNSFGEIIRQQSIIVTAPNVLTPGVLREAAILTNAVTQLLVNVTSGDEVKQVGWDDVCLKVPIIIFYTQEDEEPLPVNNGTLIGEDTETFEPSVDMDSEEFCQIVNNLELGCVQRNLLDLWEYDVQRIGVLTVDEILRKLNRTRISPVTGHTVDYLPLLSGIERNSTGHIVSAKAMTINFLANVNLSMVSMNKKFQLFGNSYWVTNEIFMWEKAFNAKLKELKEQHNGSEEKFQFYYSSARSYADVNAEMWTKTVRRLVLGFALMFVFLQIVLSKFSWLEIRLLVGLAGLCSCGMAIISGFGIAAATGYKMTTTQLSIPFLIIGLGVDDMFVIMSSLRKTHAEHSGVELAKKIALAMQSAGTSITITSLTDIVVFLVGMITVIPSLKSYCFYAAPCILMTYIFVITFFVAVLTLDERRIAARRNFLVPCVTHETRDELTKQQNLIEAIMTWSYTRLVLTRPGKVFVFVSVVVLSVSSALNIFKLEQDFDLSMFISRDTFHYDFLMQKAKLYPNLGSESNVVMGALNYSMELPKVLRMSKAIENRSDILYDFKSWAQPFRDFVLLHFQKDVGRDEMEKHEWDLYLSKFLFSSKGAAFNVNFKFQAQLECGHPAPDVRISTMDFKFKKFRGRDEYLPAKAAIEQIVEDTELDSGEGYSTVWSKMFLYWIPHAIIDEEILRNLLLGLISVTICTGFLIGNFQMCFWIQLCVLLTLIDVIGFMQCWGLQLDFITCIALQMAVGLCVDYAAHVGHTFLTIDETDKNKRTLKTLLDIGPAVVYGGTSTLLMFAALGTVDAYGCLAFFKIFFLVVSFGLYHGLVLLPVILSLVGPKAYARSCSNQPIADTKASPVYTISNGHPSDAINCSKELPNTRLTNNYSYKKKENIY